MVSERLGLGDLGHDRSGAGAGATALAGGDEHHVGAPQDLFDLGTMVLGGLPADVGIGPGTEATGQLTADVELDVGVAHQQRLGVGVDRDELDALEPGVDHPVDGVATTAADPHHLDDGEIVLRVVGHGLRAPPGAGVSAPPSFRLNVLAPADVEGEPPVEVEQSRSGRSGRSATNRGRNGLGETTTQPTRWATTRGPPSPLGIGQGVVVAVDRERSMPVDRGAVVIAGIDGVEWERWSWSAGDCVVVGLVGAGTVQPARRLIVSRLGSRTSSTSRHLRSIRPPSPVWAASSFAGMSSGGPNSTVPPAGQRERQGALGCERRVHELRTQRVGHLVEDDDHIGQRGGEVGSESKLRDVVRLAPGPLRPSRRPPLLRASAGRSPARGWTP